MPTVHVGCSGFLYDHWKGVFYPPDIPQKQWFQYYVKKFRAVELNVTFHSLPDKETFNRWYKESPQNFVFGVKGSRFITHVKKLKASEEPIDVFFSRAVALREKLGAVLWQMPPALKVDTGRLADFLELLKPYGTRNAFEFRDESWISKKVAALLEKGNASFCMADFPDFLDNLPVTSDFVYIRRHGESGNYASCYTAEQLKADAVRILRYLRQGKEVFVYFNNDASGCAPKNALELISMLKK